MHEYQSNQFGQLAKLIKPNGVELLYEYDDLGRLQKLHTEDQKLEYTYQYNLLDQVIAIHDLVADQTTQREYNEFGELVKETFAHGLAVDYAYDKLGRALQLHFPDKSAVEYVYNAVDLIEAHRLVENKKIYSHWELERNLSGQIQAARLPGQNGEIQYAYDEMGRRIKISSTAYQQEVPAGGYDPVGNLRAYQSQDQHYAFEYDDLNQLSSESGHASHQYRFNSLANRIEKDEEIHHYNALNQLIQKGQETFKYDRNGNLIERELEGRVIQYSYDLLDRLVSVKQDQTQIEYQYDPFNRRILKKQNDEAQLFLYLGKEELGLWQDNEFKEFRLLIKNETSSTAAIEINHHLYVPRHDLSGNIVCLTDEEGKVVERYRYTAFGESQVLDADDNLLKESKVGNSWQYSSKRKDNESGLIAFGLRDYDPELGRWLTPDPAGFEDGFNLYAYIHNSPLVYKDRFGQFGDGIFGVAKSFFTPFLFNLYSSTDIYLPLENTMALYGDIDKPKFIIPIEQSENIDLYQYSNVYGKDLNSQFIESKHTIGFVNGIYTSRYSSIANMSHLSEICNHNVIGTYAANLGATNDVIRYAFARMGVASETCKRIHENWNAHFDKNSDGYIFWVCHSRGAVDTRNALITYPEELRQRIVVVAVAPGGFIEDYLCKSVVHLVSNFDLVPRLDPVGWFRCQDTIEILQGSGVSDHSFTNEIYYDSIQRYYRNFLKDHS